MSLDYFINLVKFWEILKNQKMYKKGNISELFNDIEIIMRKDIMDIAIWNNNNKIPKEIKGNIYIFSFLETLCMSYKISVIMIIQDMDIY